MNVNPWWKLSGQIARAAIEIDAILHDPPDEEIADLAYKVRDALDVLEERASDVIGKEFVRLLIEAAEEFANAGGDFEELDLENA